MRPLLLLALSSPALAAPGVVPVQGYLVDAEGAPVDGSRGVTFELFDAQTGGMALWTDTISVSLSQGVFAVDLGGGATALDLDLFAAHRQIWLGVTVSGDAPMPRVALGTVPHAAWSDRAGDAATLGGSTLAEVTDLIPTATELDTLIRDVAIDASELTTILGDDYTYTAGTGLDLAGTEFSVEQGTVEGWAAGVCFDSEAELKAALDDDYVYTAGTGLVLVGRQFSADQTAIEGWARGVAYDAVGELTDELDGYYVYSAGPGLALDDNVFSLDETAVADIAADVAYDTVGELTAELDGRYVLKDPNVHVAGTLEVDGAATLTGGFRNDFGQLFTPTSYDVWRDGNEYKVTFPTGVTEALDVSGMTNGQLRATPSGNLAFLYRTTAPSRLGVRLTGSIRCALYSNEDDYPDRSGGILFATDGGNNAGAQLLEPDGRVAALERTGTTGVDVFVNAAQYTIICM